MELAKEEINSAGGIKGQKLEIVYEDFGEVDLKRAANAAQKLISIDKVSAILPMVTEDAEVVQPIAVQGNALTMAIFAGGKDLTKGKRLFYQVSSPDEALIKRLADCLTARNFNSACILAEQGAYALPLAQYAKDYLLEHGKFTPVLEEYTPQTADFRSQLVKLRASKCTSLILITPPTSQGIILRARNKMPLCCGWLRTPPTSSSSKKVLNVPQRARLRAFLLCILVDCALAQPRYEAHFVTRS
jgi:branched-chain amino acid transport system substrate-binding protein